MTLLSRYILRQNLFLLLLICAIGLGIYIFIDLFDRLDNFLGAGVPPATIAAYYLYSLPYILAQIFPAIVLIAFMVQLGLMLRNRELLALEACAVSMRPITTIVLLLATFLCVVQLSLSQGLGAGGHKASTRIWNEEVRNRDTTSAVLHNIWFQENNTIVHLGKVTPHARVGTDLSLYVLAPHDPGQVQEIIHAQSFTSTNSSGWLLTSVQRSRPAEFIQETLPTLEVDLRTDVQGFLTIDPKANLDSLPLWELGREISRLQDSGSNIERLLTAWHMKLAYSCSVLVMALIALAILSVFGSLYIIIPAGLVTTFCYYGLFMVFTSAGEKGLLPPVVAAWAANGIFMILAGVGIIRGRSFYLA